MNKDKQDIAVNSYQKKVSFENKSAKVAAMLTQLRELLNQDNCREEDDILVRSNYRCNFTTRYLKLISVGQCC